MTSTIEKKRALFDPNWRGEVPRKPSRDQVSRSIPPWNCSGSRQPCVRRRSRCPSWLPRRPGRVPAQLGQLADRVAAQGPARARSRRSHPRTVPGGTPSAAAIGRWPAPAIAAPAAVPMTSMPSARRGAHQDGSKMRAAAGPAPGPGPDAAAFSGRLAAGSPARCRAPTGPAAPGCTTGTPASRRPGRGPPRQHPGTAARARSLSGHAASIRLQPGWPQGDLVLRHAPPAPAGQPGPSRSPGNDAVTTPSPVSTRATRQTCGRPVHGHGDVVHQTRLRPPTVPRPCLP